MASSKALETKGRFGRCSEDEWPDIGLDQMKQAANIRQLSLQGVPQIEFRLGGLRVLFDTYFCPF
jgi:hypothetical protein